MTLLPSKLLPILLLLATTARAWTTNSLYTGSRHQQLQHASTTALFSTTSPSPNVVNNNIVLKPSSEQDQKFDSLKIGSARVHRYARQDSADAVTEYVMWYHGRCQTINENKALPPLSTGRIGRATSRNGLVWSKDDKGSLSEDLPDVSLGLNKEAWWGFDTAHVGLGQVLLPMSTPAVLTEGGVYIMYFFGGNFEESSVADFMDQDEANNKNNNNNSFKDASMQGMTMRIGVAVSQDGITWGRVEGDHPSGACVAPYQKSDPNTVPVNDNIVEELYCAWPEVTVDMNTKKEDEKFLMYYSTMTTQNKQKCIGCATSPDGFRWTKRGLCLQPTKGELDAAGCARCCVLRDSSYDPESKTWIESTSSTAWTMYYEGVSPTDGKHRILRATSTDGQNWTKKQGVALDIGAAESAWDFGGVGAPHVVRMDDGIMRMYYTGQSANGKTTAIGVAKMSTGDNQDEVWTREQATITLL